MEKKDVKNASVDLYKEDYTDYGWTVLCGRLGIDKSATSVIVFIQQGTIFVHKGQ